MIKKSFPFFLSILKAYSLNIQLAKILSFVFYPKAVYFECKFWISRSAITHAQNSRENAVIYSLALHFSVQTQFIIYAKHGFESLKGRNSRAAY